MMHDFFCCEAAPAQALSAAEVSSSVGRNCLLCGWLYVSVHPLDVRQESVRLFCKARGTLLDLVTSNGGALATSPLSSSCNNGNDKLEFNIEDANVVVNMDTCSVRCFLFSLILQLHY